MPQACALMRTATQQDLPARGVKATSPSARQLVGQCHLRGLLIARSIPKTRPFAQIVNKRVRGIGCSCSCTDDAAPDATRLLKP
jgi:hypothetical protein